MDITYPVKNMDYKKLILIPLIICLIFTLVIALQWNQTGSPVPLGRDFAGGTYLEIRDFRDDINYTVSKIEDAIDREFGGETELYITNDRIELETTLFLVEEDVDQLENFLYEEFGITGDYSSPQGMGPELTRLYREQAQWAAISAAIAIAVIIFIAFRHFTTVGGILSVIGLDLIGVFGGMVILNIPLTLASMAGILLVIGYAIDDNVLLYSRVLKRVGEDIRDKTAGAMKTGLTMGITSASALVVLYLISTAPALKQISAVIVIGIIIDSLNTWLFNAGIIMRHAERKGSDYRGRI